MQQINYSHAEEVTFFINSKKVEVNTFNLTQGKRVVLKLVANYNRMHNP